MATCGTIVTTSLSALDDHEWAILSNNWARGIDWVVRKIGRHWTVADCYGAWPLFRTKTAAYEAVTRLVLTESKIRARARLLAEVTS